VTVQGYWFLQEFDEHGLNQTQSRIEVPPLLTDSPDSIWSTVRPVGWIVMGCAVKEQLCFTLSLKLCVLAVPVAVVSSLPDSLLCK
jgi:hypothetical protein